MLNKATLIGHVGADPEIRYLPSGTAAANVRLATTRKWKDKASGEKRSETEWHRLVAMGPLAGVIEKYVGKGDLLYVEGRIHTRKWEDGDGKERYSTEIVVDELTMLGAKGDKADENAQGGTKRHGSVHTQRGGGENGVAGNYGGSGDGGGFDDDIPF